MRNELTTRLMSQAQVFASAWSLVGGRFDTGFACQDAEEAKQDLEGMVLAALAGKDAEIEKLKAQITAHEAQRQPLTDKKIKAGWEATFSTNNPFCPCDLRSFTKAASWAERAMLAAAPDAQA